MAVAGPRLGKNKSTEVETEKRSACFQQARLACQGKVRRRGLIVESMDPKGSASEDTLPSEIRRVG